MAKPIVLKIALANLQAETDPEAIFDFIEANGVDIETYRLDSKKVSAAAIDYVLVLSAVGSVASVAQLLWMAYDRFIAAKKRRESDTEGIYIHLDSGGNSKFWLGNHDRDKELFIETFTKKVSKFRETERAEDLYQKTQEDIRQSGIWIRRR